MRSAQSSVACSEGSRKPGSASMRAARTVKAATARADTTNKAIRENLWTMGAAPCERGPGEPAGSGSIVIRPDAGGVRDRSARVQTGEQVLPGVNDHAGAQASHEVGQH